MATISNTPRPGYVWDSTDNVWYPIGTGPHTHADYITSGSAINPNIVDAKGDIIAATAADTVARLAVGSNDQVLTADSSTATGLKWATPAAGGMTLLSTTSLSGTSTTVSSISQSYKTLFIVVRGVYSSATGSIYLRVNGDTASNYYFVVYTTQGNGGSSTEQGTPGTQYEFSHSSTASGALDVTYAQVTIPAYTETRTKQFNSWHGNKHSGSPFFKWGCCNYSGTAAITQITINHPTPTAGEVLIYGVA